MPPVFVCVLSFVCLCVLLCWLSCCGMLALHPHFVCIENSIFLFIYLYYMMNIYYIIIIKPCTVNLSFVADFEHFTHDNNNKSKKKPTHKSIHPSSPFSTRVSFFNILFVSLFRFWFCSTFTHHHRSLCARSSRFIFPS